QINIVNLRSFGLGLHHQVDDYQYGGGAGMVMMCEPLDRCIMDIKSKTKYDEIIYLTPDGKTFNQKMANRLSCLDAVLIICGHYKGIDQRIRDMHVTMEISVGDFVLSGGELAAAIVVDAIGRLIPGVLNDETSALSDSFQDNLLAPPVYTRPADFKGFKIPDILLSGNERMIDEWRYEESLKITKERRPDLLED
nr:tRNA (guanosine(37)-N1)-methyltransferase TrmD [Saprospiraceae bacterium]